VRIVTLIALPCLLTACGASLPDERPVPPPSLVAPCARPVALPDRGLSQAEVEVMWGRDRSALRTCGGQLDGLAAWAAGSR
jgi:hypothetical protein